MRSGRVAAPVVQARLSIPRTARAPLGRPRLAAILDAAHAQSRVVTVVAPPGYGKTTLVAQWAGALHAHVGWLQVESEDDDPRRFWSSTGACVGLDPTQGAIEPADVEAVLRRADGPRVLVLDDVHHLRSDVGLRALQTLVGFAPGDVTVVVISRIRPTLRWARLRVADRLCEVGPELLRFERSELDELVALVALEAEGTLGPVNLAPTLLHEVWRRTEGWPAGLTLALAAMRRAGDGAADVAASFGGDEATVAEFLREEVLSDADTSTRDFLVATSILESMQPGVCNALTGRSDSAEVLRRLWSEQRFVTATGAPTETYRYHTMLRELLLAELAGSATDPRDLHRRAASWYERAGDREGAVRHLLAAEEYERAAFHLVRLLLPNEEWGGNDQLQRWFDALPEHVRRSPDVAIAIGWSLVQAESTERAVAWARQSVGYVDVPAQQAELKLIESFGLRMLHHHDECIAAADAALDALATAPAGSRRTAFHRVMGINQKTDVAYWRGQLDEARALLDDSLGQVELSRNRLAVVRMRGVQALVEWAGGNPATARDHATLGIRLAAQLDLDRSHTVAECLLALGLVDAEAGEEDRALLSLRDASKLAAIGRWPSTAIVAHGALAVLGDVDESGDAASALDAAERVRDDPYLTARVCAIRIERALRTGALDLVAATLPRFDALPTLPETRRSVLRGAMALGDNRRIERLLPSLAAGGPLDRVVGGLVGLDRERRDPRSLALAIGAHLRTAETAGLWSSMLDALEPLVRNHPDALDSAAGDTRPNPDFAARVRAALAVRASRGGFSATLSGRELRLAEMLPTRLSNEEIAKRLYISTNTVKTHLRNIYRKLDVASRDEAVRKLREAGILNRTD